MDDRTIDGGATVVVGGATTLAGRYRVVRPLGQGGMGSVWLAEDLTLDGRPVAVKMLPAVFVTNPRAYQQLKAEAMVSLRLTHPNIAVLRSFEENAGNPFLVIDYVDGETLDDYLADRGNLSEAETVRLLTPVAAALDYAHAQGVVHRDIKPGNVMIAQDGTPFVLDFGIAREIQETMTHVTGKLSSGTLPYMSPEQLNGAPAKPPQDVYSFAAMAYECLTGHPPFSRGQIEFQIEHDAPEALPASIGIGASVMAGLAKTAAGRPATCSDVLSCVRRCPSDPPVETRKARPEAYRFTFPNGRRVPWWTQIFQRRDALPWVAVAVAVTFLIGAVAVHRHRMSVRKRAHMASVQAECMRAASEAREGAAREARQREEELKRRTDERLRKVLEKEAREAERIRVSQSRAELAMAAEQGLRQCQALDASDGVGRYVETSARLFREAKAHQARNNWAQAEIGYSNVLARCGSLARLDGWRNRAKTARSDMEKMRQKAETIGGPEKLVEADGLRKKGEDLFAILQFGKAVTAFEEAEGAYGKVVANVQREKVAAHKRADEKKRKTEEDRRRREAEIEAYRRKYYPEYYGGKPLLKPIDYLEKYTDSPEGFSPQKRRKRR